MSKKAVYTERAPAAIGPYSQAIRAGRTVYLSGQIPLPPQGTELIKAGPEKQAQRIFENLKEVAQAAGGNLTEVVKLNIYLKDLAHFPVVNEVMKTYFQPPYPARSTVAVAALPKDADMEIDAIMVLGDAPR